MKRYKTVSVNVEVEVPGLREYDVAALTDEMEDRGYVVHKAEEGKPTRNDIACATEDVDDWLHEVRVAFLTHDQQYFDVLMSRYEGRFRDELIGALAREMV